MAPPLIRISVPVALPRARVRSVKCETDAMLGSASPRNPSVRMAPRSSAVAIALLALAAMPASAPAASGRGSRNRHQMRDRAAMFDDLPHNLETAQALGMTTVLVHGLTDQFLADKPLFGAIADQLLEFVAGAEIVYHLAGQTAVTTSVASWIVAVARLMSCSITAPGSR